MTKSKSKYKIRTVKWTEEEIRSLLLRSDRMVKASVAELYKQQEPDEKAGSVTVHSNKRGFSAYDAKMLSEYARKIIRGDEIDENSVSLLRIKMLKYVKQLTFLANLRDPEYQLEFDLGGSLDEARRNTKA